MDEQSCLKLIHRPESNTGCAISPGISRTRLQLAILEAEEAVAVATVKVHVVRDQAELVEQAEQVAREAVLAQVPAAEVEMVVGPGAFRVEMDPLAVALTQSQVMAKISRTFRWTYQPV
jgi:hypothetical protein